MVQEVTGVIFDIKEFAVYDGPGIRQTVFMKGCPLRCNWCHNPEGLSAQPQLMVSAASCTHCGACAAVCQHPDGCVACGQCISVCPLRLRRIAGERLSPQQLADRILENDDYYAAQGGGVTFSGGEPLMQAAFLQQTLDLLPHTHKAIETSGYADADVFNAVVKRLDYVMMDVKLVDDALHQRYTGVSNQKILRNLKSLCQGTLPFVVRIPVIPGVNDSVQNFEATARLIAGAPALQKVELLPYHKTAGAKYEMVGKAYQPLFHTEQPVAIHQEIFSRYQIRSEVL